MARKTIASIFLLAACFQASAQELHEELKGVWRAEVVRVVKEENHKVPGTETIAKYQTLEVKILEGSKSGEVVIVENDFLGLSPGDVFFLNYFQDINGQITYSVNEPDRRPQIYLIAGLFVAVVIIFGGFTGLRALMGLAASLFIIVKFMLPSLLQGYSPVLMSVVFSVLILGIAIYVTHGFNRKSHTAFAGSVFTVAITGSIAHYAVRLTQLSGFSSDETVYLNLGTAGSLDFQGLLLGAIIIGALGVLDDIAVTQAAAVEELRKLSPDISKKDLYMRALAIGREHVGALINTLALSYTGAALPLLLLFVNFGVEDITLLLNREIFATELIRTIVGSIGLILAVPISTALAVWFMA